MAIEITVRSGEELRQVRARLGDQRTLGNIIGRILESQSQKAFLDQRLGEFAWPERYPSQDDPFVNTAALVNWTKEGGEITRRFFDRRPSLVGTGDLMQSISSRFANGAVETGSALGYAGLHQEGGSSTQPITPAAKKTIARFIGEEPDGKGGWKTKKRLEARQKENREKYWSKLFPLLSSDELTTEVHQRPFLGVTPENDADIAESIEIYVARGEGA